MNVKIWRALSLLLGLSLTPSFSEVGAADPPSFTKAPAALTQPATPALAPQQVRRSAKQRKIILESTRNTRDLGGLPTRRGYIKNGRIFRSGALCYATKADQQTVASLQLQTVIDLRIDREIRDKEGPDRLPPAASIRLLHLPMANKSGNTLGRYYSYAVDNDEAIQGFFASLAKEHNYPLLFHCSAGKDRTGVLTALLLELLGTERPIIMDDYLESQRNSANLKVQRAWLREVFQLIDKAGGIVPFLRAHGVAAADLRAIPGILEVQ